MPGRSYNEEEDVASDNEDEYIDINDIYGDRLNGSDSDENNELSTSIQEDFFEFLNNLNEDDVLKQLDCDEIVCKDGRPYVDYCDLNFNDSNIPININEG